MLRQGDLEGILADYSPTAVMFTPTGVLKGPAAIRPVFQTLFAEFGKPGTSFSMQHRSVDGDFAYLVWNAETAETCMSWEATPLACAAAG